MKYIYYNPEDFGLTAVGEIEYSSGHYEFDTRVVWLTETGRLVTARDSGCSCPIPFEDYHSVADLEDITDNFSSYLRAEFLESLNNHTQYAKLEDVQWLVDQCRELVRTF